MSSASEAFGGLRQSHRGLAPISLAAYATWAPISISALDLHRPAHSALLAGDHRAVLAAVLLLLFIALFAFAAILRNRSAGLGLPGVALALAQGLCACAANALLPDRAVAILLILVVAQLSAFLGIWVNVLCMAVLNALMLAPQLLQHGGLSTIVAYVPIIGFQIFAALTMRYALSAERARDQLLVTNAELVATRSLLTESARSDERLRLSRELHDVAGHSLTALKLNLNAALLDPQLHQRAELNSAAQLATDLLAQIRQVVGALRAHDGVDLREALTALSQAIPSAVVRLDFPAQLRVDHVDQAEALLRCTQEAITNALRHAGASRIEITLARDPTHLHMTVLNNGRVPDHVEPGNGLTGMRERLEALGGRIEFKTSKDQFGVYISLPCETP